MTEELKSKRLSTQQKLGRNILLFQALERQLKIITPFMDAQGIALTPETILKAQDIKSSKKTLGTLFGKFQDSLQLNSDEPMRENATAITMRHSLTLPIEVQKEWKEKLEALSDSRNEIVHHFFDNYKMNSIEDLTKAEKCLDDQQKDIVTWLKTFADIMKAFAETSSESMKVMDSISVVRQFVDISGWQFEYTIPDDKTSHNP